jgi:hypothetical protein
MHTVVRASYSVFTGQNATQVIAFREALNAIGESLHEPRELLVQHGYESMTRI